LVEGAWEQAGVLGLSSTPLLSIGALEGPDEQILYRVSGGAVLDDGRIAILNGGAREVRYYGADGRFLGRQGGAGEGPGEYSSPVDLWSLPGDTIIVWDLWLSRATVVGPTGTVVRDVPVPGDPRARSVLGVFADHSFLVFQQRLEQEQESTDQQYQGYYSRFSREGDSLNAIGEFPWMRMIVNPPGGREGPTVIAMAPPMLDATTKVAVTGNGLWVGTTKKEEILFMDNLGGIHRIVRWFGPDRTVTDAVKEAFFVELRERMAAQAPPGEAREPSRDLPFADFLPSHGELVAREDGGLWMEESRTPGSEPSNRWRIFGPRGLPEGLVELPLEAQVLWAGVNQVLLLEQDDLGVEYVRLYALESEV
jgi:hypothetical protein